MAQTFNYLKIIEYPHWDEIIDTIYQPCMVEVGLIVLFEILVGYS
jgi:hypothetical protein